MPPLVARKRRRSQSDAANQSSSPPKTISNRKKQETLFDTATSNPRLKSTVEENKAYLDSLHDEESHQTGKSSATDSDDYENVLPGEPENKRRKMQHEHARNNDGGDGTDEDIDWEDVPKHSDEHHSSAPVISGDLELTLEELPETSVGYPKSAGKKTGPSKKQRQIRTSTHCIHVQSLLFHNLIRNGWACDKQTQKILTSGLPAGITNEVEKWKERCGILSDDRGDGPKAEGNSKGQKRKRKDRGKKEISQRDWGSKAEQQAHDSSSINQGDATVKLLKVLTAFWRKRFTVNAPGLRKDGWKDARRLAKEVEAFQNGEHDPEEHGERVKSKEEFRDQARKYEGSRDLGSQLFTALLRGLGIETRLVASLQPLGLSWTKNEEAAPPRPQKRKDTTTASTQDSSRRGYDVEMRPELPAQRGKPTDKSTSKPKQKSRSGGHKSMPIELSDDSGLSSAPESESDDSIMDITPPIPTTSVRKYDRDLQYPHYWVEVLSPTHQTWIPVEPLVLSVVAYNDELLAQFEPRGAKAEKSKQAFCYVVAYASDGTAKDVTTRYLKKHQWPGKTKGFRMPVEKIPIYNKNGKVTRHEEYDWFKHVMRLYERPDCRRTTADKIEDTRDLVAVKAVRETKPGEEDVMTLQGLKTSPDFVLERHLRREEALLPLAKSVKLFKIGKGDNVKEEAVFRRTDVVSCKTVESWHKEGREVKEGEQPLKMVAFRAVTTIRKRELEEAERASGEKMKQGLYSRAQTDWIIPPPIEDGIIPKNAYGNMDVYVPSMVPHGAIHIPLRGTTKICRKLGIDFAEACTGFEFGHRMAVPVLTGVVVAAENEDMVIDAWEVEEEIKRKKEKEKREKLALTLWKKMLSGMKIVERVKRQYGDQAESHMGQALKSISGAAKGKRSKKSETLQAEQVQDLQTEDDMQAVSKHESELDVASDIGGGFILDDTDAGGSGFVLDDLNENDRASAASGGFFLDGQTQSADTGLAPNSGIANANRRTPVSLHSLHQRVDESSSLSEVEDSESEQEATPVRRKPQRKKTTKDAKRFSVKSSVISQTAKTEPTPPESPEDNEDASLVADDNTDGEASSALRFKRKHKPQTKSLSTRMTGKRAAARDSANKVRSHYFEASEED